MAWQNKQLSIPELYEAIAPRGFVPPNDRNAEKSVLGAILIDVNAMARAITVLGERGEEDTPFYDERNTLVWLAAQKLFRENMRPDIVTVASTLRAMGKLEAVGGPPYLVELSAEVVHTNVEEHCQIIQDRWLARELIRLGEEQKLMAFRGEDTSADLLNVYGEKLYKLSNTDVRRTGRPVVEVLRSAMALSDRAARSPGGVSGLPFGIRELDEITGGCRGGELILFAARPSVGKTSFGVQAAVNMASAGMGEVIFSSLEMNAEVLGFRILANIANVNSYHLMQGRLLPEEHERIGPAMIRARDLNLYIDDSDVTPMELVARLRRRMQRGKVAALFVDYLQLMRPGVKCESRQLEVTYIGQSLKRIAKEYDIPVVAMCQLNRATLDTMEPNLSDLRESGALEQEADIVMFLHRLATDGVWQHQEKIQASVKKNRNGSTGIETLTFSKESSIWNRYTELPPDSYNYEVL